MPRLNLLTKIFLGLLLVGLLPLGIASYRLLGLNRTAMTEQVLRTHAVAAQTTAARVEAFLTARREVARGAAANPLLAENPRSPAATAVLSELLRSPLGVIAVSVRNAEGDEVVRAQRKEWGEAVGALLEQQNPVGASLLRLSVPLAGSDSALVLVCDLEPLAQHLQPRELGALAELVLVDGEGRSILETAPGTADLANFPPAMLQAALSGKISGSGRFSAGDGKGEEAILGAYAPIDLPTLDGRWFVLSRQPASVAEATARQLRQRGLLAIGVAVLLTLAAAAVAHRSVVRPIRELTAAQRRLAGADAQIPTTGGEIAQLKAAFQLLERRLKEKEELDKVFLGRYQVQEVVGEGAMGMVFRGWDPTLKRPVALKTLRFDGNPEPERAEHAARLLQEAVAVARFNHPNIVGIYDIQQSPEVAFLSLEFVDGESLEDHLHRRSPLPPEAVLQLGLGIARGLAAAHDRGTMHRDIKPANILLGREGEIKIADFGISEMMTSLAPDPSMVFGTPGFIPPETLLGEGYSPAGDLFALGATLYRLLVGALPFSGTNVTEMVSRTVTDPVIRPGALDPTVPPDLEALILDLLDKEPEQRPTAAEVVARLEEMAAALELPQATQSRNLPWNLTANNGPAKGRNTAAPTRAMPSSQLITLHPRG